MATNPSRGIGRCYNYSLTAHGFSEVSPEEVASVIGPPLDEGFRKFCPGADPALVESLISKYRERYAEIGYAENELYPEVAEELRALASAGIRLGVCTSKRRDFAEKILAMFGLLPLFAFVDGADVGTKKREQLARLLRTNDIDHHTHMIGDRAVDILAAKDNDLLGVGVLWGFGDRGELEAADPVLILESASDLRRLGGAQWAP